MFNLKKQTSMKTTMCKIRFFLLAILLFTSILVNAQRSGKEGYARLKYMGVDIELNQAFFIKYNEIYKANIAKLEKKEKKRPAWNKVNEVIVGYLSNPSVVISLNESGKIAMGPADFIKLDGVYENKKGQEKKDNKKAAQLYGSILPATINWYVKKAIEWETY